MTSMIDSQAMHDLLRVIEKFNGPNLAKITVGHFEQDGQKYGIRLQKSRFNPEHGNILYTIWLSIEIPTSSGLTFVPIGEFSAMHPDSFHGYETSVRFDKNWVTWHTSINHDQTKCNINVSPMNSVVHRQRFDIEGEVPEELANDLEGQLFQHNLVCEEHMVVDEQYVRECFNFVLEEFQAMYKGAELTSIDIMPTMIQVSLGGVSFPVPYKKIVKEIEKYVQNQGQ